VTRDELRAAVLATLGVYAERGREALAALDEAGAEAFLACLKRRDAAFHNLRALDARARKAGFDMAADADAVRLWGEIEPMNARLAELMQAALDELSARGARLSAARTYAQACHSGGDAPRLVKAS
jgi:hypothetical protein